MSIQISYWFGWFHVKEEYTCALPNEKGISTNKGKEREENASFSLTMKALGKSVTCTINEEEIYVFPFVCTRMCGMYGHSSRYI